MFHWWAFGFWRTREWVPGLTREIRAAAEKNPSGIYIGDAEHRPAQLTVTRAAVSAAAVSRLQVILSPAQPLVVGSFGNVESLAATTYQQALAACDLLEIRLDLLEDPEARPWAHLTGIPMLFTARRGDEGGKGDLSAARRSELLAAVLDEASLIDVELHSAGEMSDVLAEATRRGVPWVASWHDFLGNGDARLRIRKMAEQATQAGAACFKAAIRLHGVQDLCWMQQTMVQRAELKSLPIALMGMGALAPVSRLLCAQYGSVLNYGFIGDAPTAPGQWSAGLLKEAVRASEIGLM
jgi:3-dehydroquinate dehydratase-1